MISVNIIIKRVFAEESANKLLDSLRLFRLRELPRQLYTCGKHEGRSKDAFVPASWQAVTGNAIPVCIALKTSLAIKGEVKRM